jgi:sulfur carrier protein
MTLTKLTVNGELRETASENIESLIQELGLHPPLVLVEHNARAVLRSEWNGVRLQEGDKLELLTVFAGG